MYDPSVNCLMISRYITAEDAKGSTLFRYTAGLYGDRFPRVVDTDPDPGSREPGVPRRLSTPGLQSVYMKCDKEGHLPI
jgi:hypothetical protein